MIVDSNHHVAGKDMCDCVNANAAAKCDVEVTVGLQLISCGGREYEVSVSLSRRQRTCCRQEAVYYHSVNPVSAHW
jgi:hypothetical protein